MLAVPAMVTRLTLTNITIVPWDTSGTILTRLAGFTQIKSCISTIAKPTHRGLLQPVNVIPVTHFYLDVGIPIAAASTPVKAHFAVDNLSHSCWM